MPQPPDQPNYTIKAAAARVGRDPRTVERWIRGGLACRQVAGIIVIAHDDLLRRYREQILSNPNRKKSKDT